MLTRTCAFGAYDGNYVLALQRRTDHLGAAAPAGVSRQRLWHIRARQVVLATGAHPRPLVFADNDRPGVMLAHAVSTYLHHYGVLPGRRAVVATTDDSAYATAADLAAAGCAVAAVVDSRPELTDTAREFRDRTGVPVRTGSAVTATSGTDRIDGVAVHPLDAAGLPPGPARRCPASCWPSRAAGARWCICTASGRAPCAGTRTSPRSCPARRWTDSISPVRCGARTTPPDASPRGPVPGRWRRPPRAFRLPSRRRTGRRPRRRYGRCGWSPATATTRPPGTPISSISRGR